MTRETHTEHVYRLVCSYPGYPVAWLAWIEAGGRVENGRPVGSTRENSFRQHHRILSLQKRVNDLIESGRVVWGELVVETKTRGRGVWPVERADIVQQPSVNQVPPKRRDVGHSAIRAALNLTRG